MSEEFICSRLLDLLILDFGVDLSDDEAESLMEQEISSFGLDSLDIYEFMLACEYEFDVEIPESDFVGFNTVGDLVQYIHIQT